MAAASMFCSEDVVDGLPLLLLLLFDDDDDVDDGDVENNFSATLVVDDDVDGVVAVVGTGVIL